MSNPIITPAHVAHLAADRVSGSPSWAGDRAGGVTYSRLARMIGADTSLAPEIDWDDDTGVLTGAALEYAIEATEEVTFYNWYNHANPANETKAGFGAVCAGERGFYAVGEKNTAMFRPYDSPEWELLGDIGETAFFLYLGYNPINDTVYATLQGKSKYATWAADDLSLLKVEQKKLYNFIYTGEMFIALRNLREYLYLDEDNNWQTAAGLGTSYNGVVVYVSPREIVFADGLFAQVYDNQIVITPDFKTASIYTKPDFLTAMYAIARIDGGWLVGGKAQTKDDPLAFILRDDGEIVPCDFPHNSVYEQLKKIIVTDKKVFALDNGGNRYESFDGGASFEADKTPISSLYRMANVKDACVGKNGEVLVVCYHGYIYSTLDWEWLGGEKPVE